MRTREAERQFSDALRAPRAFCVKATPDYKALARIRRTERRFWVLGKGMAAIFTALTILYAAGAI